MIQTLRADVRRAMDKPTNSAVGVCGSVPIDELGRCLASKADSVQCVIIGRNGGMMNRLPIATTLTSSPLRVKPAESADQTQASAASCRPGRIRTGLRAGGRYPGFEQSTL